MIVNHGHENPSRHGGKIDALGSEVHVSHRNMTKNHCSKSLLGNIAWGKLLVGPAVILSLVGRYSGANPFERLTARKGLLLGSFFEGNTKGLLVSFVGTAYELEDFLVCSETHSLEGDNDRDEFLERVVPEIETVGFTDDIGFDNSVVR